MSVIVNGCGRDLPEPETLAALLRSLAPQTPFAVARNGVFVPRAAYVDCTLEPGDVIEIVHPMAGG